MIVSLGELQSDGKNARTHHVPLQKYTLFEDQILFHARKAEREAEVAKERAAKEKEKEKEKAEDEMEVDGEVMQLCVCADRNEGQRQR
jgi:hypothetical protein